MRPRSLSAVGSYAVAASATAAALLISGSTAPWVGDHLLLAPLFGAIAISAWYGGYGPSIVALALGALAYDYFFLEPSRRFDLGRVEDYVAVSIFVFTAAIVVLLGETLRASQRRTREEQERLRTILASIGEAIIVTDAKGRITSVNAVAESLTGWTRQEASGLPLEDVFRVLDESTREPREIPIDEVSERGRVVSLTSHLLLRKDGSECPVEDSAVPSRGTNGEIVSCMLVFRDITDRRRAERTLRLLASIVDSSDDAIIGRDLNGVITSWNKAAERLFGYSASEALGRPIEILAPDDRPQEMAEILERLRDGEHVHHFDTIRRAKDGSLLPISLTVSPIKDQRGRLIGVSKIARDISERKRSEEVIAEEKARLHATLHGIGDGVIVTDTEGRIQMMNPVARDLTGWGDEAKDQPLERVFRIVNEHTRSTVENPAMKALREGVIVGLANHTTLIAKDGVERPIDDSAAPIRDAEGRILGCVLVFRDISARRAAEAELRKAEERARLVLENVLDGIFTMDDRGSVLSFNPAAERLFGHSAAEVIGRNVEELLPERYRQSPSGKEQILGSEREIMGLRKDGSTFAMEVTVSEFDEDDRRCRCCIVRDITERKNAEEALKEADRHKNVFLATLAHELRNPLAPIRNANRILVEKCSPVPEIEWCSQVIDRQVQHMARLLDDLLDVSRISHNKLELRKQRSDLAAIVTSAVETSHPLIDRKEQRLDLVLPAEPIHLDADPVRLAQVFSNLLNNAAKYGEPRGHIRLTAERREHAVLVSVEDDGIGIDPEMLPRIFDIFSQSRHLIERSQEGLGIGLWLVRGLVELHGGSIEAQSGGLGQGSRFVVSLPLAVECAESVDGERRHEGSGEERAKHRLLIVDDSEDSTDTLAALLELKGHEVRTAYDGEEAIRVAEEFAPDVVLLDIEMPKLNGYDACRRLREGPRGPDLYLIAVTGWGQKADRRRTEEAGFDHHLVKPLEPSELMRLLDSRHEGQGTA